MVLFVFWFSVVSEIKDVEMHKIQESFLDPRREAFIAAEMQSLVMYTLDTRPFVEFRDIIGLFKVSEKIFRNENGFR